MVRLRCPGGCIPWLPRQTRRNSALTFICPLQRAQPPAWVSYLVSRPRQLLPMPTAFFTTACSQVVQIFPGTSSLLPGPFSSWFIQILRTLKLKALSSQYLGAGAGSRGHSLSLCRLDCPSPHSLPPARPAAHSFHLKNTASPAACS